MVKYIFEQSVIQESHSLWKSSRFLVPPPKKDKTFRPVIDFRCASVVTLDGHYSLPVLSDILMSQSRGNSIFSSLDLFFGHWQVELKVALRRIIAFSMPSGHYEWLRFGLRRIRREPTKVPCTDKRFGPPWIMQQENTPCGYMYWLS